MKDFFRFACLGFFAGLTVLRAVESDDKVVTFTEQQDGKAVRLVAWVRDGADVTVTLEADLQNVTSSHPLPYTFDLSGQRSAVAVIVRAADAAAAWRYQYRFFWSLGTRQGRPEASAIYRLPFAQNETHRLQQGNFGHFSHGQGSQNERAFDFRMPVGTTVCAARAGTVCGARSDSTAGGVSPVFKQRANYVIIRHADGTYAEYFHLATDGVKVRIGETVVAGQPIALSGNTGFSSEPHLHFCVFRTLDGKTRETLPALFRVGGGKPESLVEGRSY
ncbi:MAG: mepM [Verrucomicrobia bacterium]|nr:mepM [Verrucomicrobiota bacterium]